jgi:hypothetical protein
LGSPDGLGGDLHDVNIVSTGGENAIQAYAMCYNNAARAVYGCHLGEAGKLRI